MNPLNRHLMGKYVVMSPKTWKGPLLARVIRCVKGPGCDPAAKGRSITGFCVFDGEPVGTFDSREIERLAEEGEWLKAIGQGWEGRKRPKD